MKYQNSSNLISLAVIANGNDSTISRELAIQDLISRHWERVVGPTLAHQTHLIRIHYGTMLIGCWHRNKVLSLRTSAETIWPQIQARVEYFWKLKLRSLVIVPCDQPTKPSHLTKTDNSKESDPFMEVLNFLRKRNKS